MHHGNAFTLQIHAPFGEPDGLRIIERDNWTGQAVAFPRSRMAQSRLVGELTGRGVYVLRGPEPEGDYDNRIYVGRSRKVMDRIGEHDGDKKKEWWTEAVGFTSRDANLTSAHTEYLEARLWELATEAERCRLDNREEVRSERFPLSRADNATAETFLENLLVCLRATGIHEFDPLHDAAAKTGEPVFKFQRGQVVARGVDKVDGFVVFAESLARISQAPTFKDTRAERRRDGLIAEGVLERVEESLLRFNRDYRFGSAGIAGTICYGTFGPDRTSWIGPDGRTLKQWQDEGPTE